MPATATSSRPGADAFDFFIGDWQVEHRRLRRRLVGDSEWLTFGGRTSTRKILGGLGNIDENVVDLPGGAYEAVSLRLFQPADGQWSIWWIDGREPALTAPVHGHFDAAGIGTFFGDDDFEGRPIRVRFVWSCITDQTAQWEQAFSADGGDHWETNWVMRFERAA
jgi:hypothetical protein